MELPLAVPLTMAGLRVASVSTIGLVTISGAIGDRFGGLGFFIFEGYRRGFPTEILFGAVPSMLLAVVVDLALVAAQRRVTPWATAQDEQAGGGGTGRDGVEPPPAGARADAAGAA